MDSKPNENFVRISSLGNSDFALSDTIIFVVFGIWMILEAENIKTPFLRNPLLIRIVGVSSVLFFGYAVFVMTKQLFQKKLILTLDEKGINLKPLADRIVKWKDIIYFSEIKINSVKIIIIHVKNPEDYIDNEPNKIHKKLINYNLNNYGSPFTITVSTMDIDYEELLGLLNDNLKQTLTRLTNHKPNSTNCN